MIPLIGLTGYSRSGKDTFARLLSEQFRVGLVAFATPLKRECADAWQVDVGLFNGPDKELPTMALALDRCTDTEFRAEHWHLANLPTLKPRTVMQAWGRWMHHRDRGRYVRLAAAAVVEIAATEPQAVVITDVRLHHERDWLRSQGGLLWRVVHPDRTSPPSGDATEKEQMHWAYDALIVNNGSTEQLAKIARDLFLDATVPAECRSTTTGG